MAPFPAHWNHTRAIITVFVLFAGIYLLMRLGTAPVFDDTSSHLRWGDPGEMSVSQACPDLVDAASTAFGQIHTSGYRPLSLVVSDYFGCRVANGTIPYSLWIVVIALIWGATAAVFFWLARKIIDDAWMSMAAVVLFMATPPFIAASWVTWAGIQAIVPLLLTLGMGLYAGELSQRRVTWRTWALAAIFFVGPWFREFVGVLAFVILASETVRWIQGHRDKAALACLAALGAAHAMFPTVLPHLAGFRELPILLVAKLGFLGTRVAADRFMHEAAEVALLLMPPIFMAVTAIAFLLAKPRLDTSLGRWFARLRLVTCLAAVLLLVAYLYFSHPLLQWFAVLVLALVPAVFALTRHLWLALWYSASFLPFLRLYSIETHLLYLAAPLALIAGAAMKDLFAGATQANSRLARLALLAAATVGVLDQAINIPASRLVMQRLSESTARVAQFLQQHVAAGSAVVINAKQGLDIALFARNHAKMYFSNEPVPGRAILSLDQFAQFIGNARDDVYLLSVDAPAKLPYHQHKYVVLRAVEMRPVARIDTAVVQHPVLDPLRMLLDTRRVSFLGPPDFFYDIYSGPARSGQKLLREHQASYTLFKVTGRNVTRDQREGGWLPSLNSPDVGLLKAIWEAKNLKAQPGAPERPAYRGYARTCDAASCYAVKLSDGDATSRAPSDQQTEPSRWVVEASEEKLIKMVDTLENSPDVTGLPWLKSR